LRVGRRTGGETQAQAKEQQALDFFH
jgi:hypothetical protein